jgi:hypothetical protein
LQTVNPTSTYKPRPSVARGRGFYKTGEAVWGRDVFHIQKSGMTTLCGRDCSEWMRMDPRPAAEAKADKDCCARCAAQL